MTPTTSTLTHQLHQSRVVAGLTELAFNRTTALLEHQHAVSDHHLARASWLDEATEELSDVEPSTLLAELRQSGLLWSVVAEIVGVTDAAVRKWRKDQPIDPRHHRRLARLAALARLHAEYAPSASDTGFAEWLDTRIVRSFSATPLGLLKLNRDRGSARLQPLLDWMLDHTDGDEGEALLDRYLGREWRDEAREEQRYRIVTDGAGDRILLIDG